MASEMLSSLQRAPAGMPGALAALACSEVLNTLMTAASSTPAALTTAAGRPKTLSWKRGSGDALAEGAKALEAVGVEEGEESAAPSVEEALREGEGGLPVVEEGVDDGGGDAPLGRAEADTVEAGDGLAVVFTAGADTV